MSSLQFILLTLLLAMAASRQILWGPLSPQIKLHGRFHVESGSVRYDWTCFKIDFCFQNATKVVWLVEDKWNIYHLLVDDAPPRRLKPGKLTKVEIFQSSQQQSHCVQIVKITQNHYGPIASYKDSTFGGIQIEGGVLLARKRQYSYRFQFMGDSLTTGFGVQSGTSPLCFFRMKQVQNCLESWATHLSQHFNAEYRIEAVSGKGVMRNSLAVFGKKMPTLFTRVSDNSAINTYKFEDGYFPHILFICIGHNDFANLKDPTPQNFLRAYKEMLQQILSAQFGYMGKGTKLVNVCPAQFIPQVCVLVQRAVEEFHYGYDKIYYLEIPVGTIEKKDMGCMGHPNVTGHRNMAKALIKGVQKILDIEEDVIQSIKTLD